jgi:hypothetical protein
MADSLADKQARLDALLKMRDSGVLSVRHGDTSTVFRSLNELLAAIAALEGEIAGIGGTLVRRIRYPYQSGKGL